MLTAARATMSATLLDTVLRDLQDRAMQTWLPRMTHDRRVSEVGAPLVLMIDHIVHSRCSSRG